MSFPDNGAYYTFHLDPVASLQDIEDEEVAKAARGISPKVYVACTIKTIGAPQLPPAYEVADIALVQQGLPPDSPGEFLESRIERSDIPYWQILAARRAERLARPPLQLHVEIDENWDAETDYSSDYSDGGSAVPADPPAAGPTHSGLEAQDEVVREPTPAVDNVAEVENDIIAALTHRADLNTVSPVIVPLSYDLSTLPSPPSPTGFMEELAAIRKIRSDYEERVRRLKQEVQRRDDEYMADIQARRTEEPVAQVKWPLLGGFVPFTNKVKARLGAFEVHVPDEQLAVEGEAKDVQIADVLVRLEAFEVVNSADGLVVEGIPKIASLDEVDIMIDIMYHDL
ncbi:hypothetical protein FB107DRAFT_271641 [Schizophyllum commune]